MLSRGLSDDLHGKPEWASDHMTCGPRSDLVLTVGGRLCRHLISIPSTTWDISLTYQRQASNMRSHLGYRFTPWSLLPNSPGVVYASVQHYEHLMTVSGSTSAMIPLTLCHFWSLGNVLSFRPKLSSMTTKCDQAIVHWTTNISLPGSIQVCFISVGYYPFHSAS